MRKNRTVTEMNTGALIASDMNRPKYKILYTLIVLYLIIIIAAVAFPALWMVLTCFKEPAEIASVKQSFFPKHYDFGKIWTVFSKLKLYRYYVNTIVMSLGAVVFDVVFNGLAGYVLSRLKPLGSKFYFGLVTTMLLVTGGVVPLYMTFTDFPIGHFSMMGTYWPIWLMAGANMFNILLFKTSFDGISISLIEAAKIDGATSVKIFTKIVIPMSIPVITTVAIFTFNGNFGSFFWPLLLLPEPAQQPFGVALFRFKTDPAISMDWKMIATFFSTIPQLLVFIAFQKKIIGGINLGGVKG